MFKIGDEVSYGLHGKCVITGIQEKNFNDSVQTFYTLKSVKQSNNSAAKKNEPQIFIPVDAAANKGLRHPITRPIAEGILKSIADGDFYLNITDSWHLKQKQLDELIRNQGALGIAKCAAHLFVLLKKEIGPKNEIIKIYDQSIKVLIRELSESLEISSKETEILLLRAFKLKAATKSN